MQRTAAVKHDTSTVPRAFNHSLHEQLKNHNKIASVLLRRCLAFSYLTPNTNTRAEFFISRRKDSKTVAAIRFLIIWPTLYDNSRSNHVDDDHIADKATPYQSISVLIIVIEFVSSYCKPSQGRYGCSFPYALPNSIFRLLLNLAAVTDIYRKQSVLASTMWSGRWRCSYRTRRVCGAISHGKARAIRPVYSQSPCSCRLDSQSRPLAKTGAVNVVRHSIDHQNE